MGGVAVALHDRSAIAEVLLRSPLLHIYELGDLDDFFWPHTIWYGLEHDGRIEAVALLYTGSPLPALLALHEPPVDATRELLRRIRHLLPRRLDAHLSEGVLAGLEGDYVPRLRGVHDKMALTDPARIDGVDTTGVARLDARDLGAIQELYDASYPGNWFNPRMLETGQFFGVWSEGHDRLESIAGIHVYSPRYGVAAIGNITTRPALRGRGLSTRTTAALCRSLRGQVARIGLNVDGENEAAIACYRRLGFTRVGAYHEMDLDLAV